MAPGGRNRRGRGGGQEARGRGSRQKPPPKDAPPPPQYIVPESFQIETTKMLMSIREEGLQAVSFPPTLDSTQRRFIHSMCTRLGLHSKSQGKGDNRYITVYRDKDTATGGAGKQERQGPAQYLSLPEDMLSAIEEYYQAQPMTKREIEEVDNRHQDLLQVPVIRRLGAPSLAHRKGHESELRERRAQYEKWKERVDSSKVLKNINEARARLPTTKHKEEIIKMIKTHQVSIVSGETGCGKSTQVPQYILEDEELGPTCKIVVTQPRRISAIALAERVSYERGENVGQSVGYSIRLESSVSSATQLTFMTVGVLLRKISNDRLLSEFTHIILDEVHERDRLCDFMLILIRDILPLRPDLRVVLMSATIQLETFRSYFASCPVIQVQGQAFPVTECFLEDILALTHFVSRPSRKKRGTGGGDQIYSLQMDEEEKEQQVDGSQTEQREYWCPLCQTALESAEAFGSHITDCLGAAQAPQSVASAEGGSAGDLVRQEIERQKLLSSEVEEMLSVYQGEWNDEAVDLDLIEALLTHLDMKNYGEGAVLVFLPGWDDISSLMAKLLSNHRFCNRSRYWILPLHSGVSYSEAKDMLCSTAKQKEVFRHPPPGCRKIILATNIAETSITIDDVVFVVDGGKMKMKNYDPHLAMATFQPQWVAKANAQQRRGRAGRTQPGVCFHTFSRTRFDAMDDFPTPELLRTPLEELVLQVKLLDSTGELEGPGGVEEFLSKAPEPPHPKAVHNALTLLKNLGALTEEESLTALGLHLASLPLEPRLGKMILLGHLLRCIDPVITVGCGISYRDPFLLPMNFEQKLEASRVKVELSQGLRSDHLTALRAFYSWELTEAEGGTDAGWRFCNDHFLSLPTLSMVKQMIPQMANELAKVGFGRRSREEFEDLNSHSRNWGVLRAVLSAGLYPNVVRRDKGQKNFRTFDGKSTKFHMSSVCAQDGDSMKRERKKKDRDWMVFTEIIQTKDIFTVRDNTPMSLLALLLLCGNTEHTEIVRRRRRRCDLDFEDDDEMDEIDLDDLEDDEDEDDDVLYMAQFADSKGLLDEIDEEEEEREKILVLDEKIRFKMTQELCDQLVTLRRRFQHAFLFHIDNPQEALPPQHEATVSLILELLEMEGPEEIRHGKLRERERPRWGRGGSRRGGRGGGRRERSDGGSSRGAEREGGLVWRGGRGRGGRGDRRDRGSIADVYAVETMTLSYREEQVTYFGHSEGGSRGRGGQGRGGRGRGRSYGGGRGRGSRGRY